MNECYPIVDCYERPRSSAEGTICAGVQPHLTCLADTEGSVLTLAGVPQGTLTTSMGTGNLRARMAPAPRSMPATSLTTLTTSAAPSSTAWTRSCSKTTSSGRCKLHPLSEH